MKQTEGYCDPSVWLSIVQELVCRVGCDKETLQPGRLASYRGESSLRAWLRPVIRNYLTDRSRPEALRIADFDLRDTSLWKLSSEIEASGSAPLELLEYFRVHLLRALSELTPIQRRILFMYFGEHRHNYSIAVILGISPGNVSRQRKIAVDQLVSLMRDAVTSMTQVAEKQAFLALWDKRRSLPRPELVDVLLGGLESGYRIGVDPIGFVRGPGNPNFSETGVCDEPWPNSRHTEIQTKPREDKEKGSSAVES
jgi:RNA polymerase sigma factor (sigma-70 family)